MFWHVIHQNKIITYIIIVVVVVITTNGLEPIYEVLQPVEPV